MSNSSVAMYMYNKDEGLSYSKLESNLNNLVLNFINYNHYNKPPLNISQ